MPDSISGLYFFLCNCYNTYNLVKDVFLLKIKGLFPLKINLTRRKLIKIIRTEALILCIAAFLLSAGFLGDYYLKSYKQKKQNEALSNLVQQDNTGTDSLDDYTNETLDENFTLPESSKYSKVVHPKNNKIMLIQTQYLDVFNLNPDLVGWIYIPGTQVNYPVVQSPEWVNYYLTRDFYGQESKHGAIYVDEMANVKTPSHNVTIYGHKMKDGSMFADLLNYSDKAFYNANPIIEFNTIYENHTYQIFSVFITTANEGGFDYHNFVDGTEEEFDAFVAKCKELSLYDTGVSVAYGDKLITLSTCEHNVANGRYVVVAKQIS